MTGTDPALGRGHPRSGPARQRSFALDPERIEAAERIERPWRRTETAAAFAVAVKKERKPLPLPLLLKKHEAKKANKGSNKEPVKGTPNKVPGAYEGRNGYRYNI